MSSVAAEVRAVRAGGGLFRLSSGGLFSVTGSDAQRWLGGMISNDVMQLAPGPETSGCYAALLTPKGMVVSDLHVLVRPGGEGYWIETAPEAREGVLARLDRYIIADDVTLMRLDDEVTRFGLEGPSARAALEAAADERPAIRPDCAARIEIAGAVVLAAAYGWSGEPAFQIFAPPHLAEDVATALLAHADIEPVGDAALEILRIEAGRPAWSSEFIDEDVLPDEARLERAISLDKGCYTGQEIIARLRSRGQVNHLLVGLRFEGGSNPEDLPPIGAKLRIDDRETGEVTSVCVSPEAGAIGLGFVRRAAAEPDTILSAEAFDVRVSALPLVASRAGDS